MRAVLNRLGSARTAVGADARKEMALEADVRSVLDGGGYTVERAVGDTGFRLNLAVHHPDPKKGFVLGVECDGGVWFSDRSARIREVWRPEVLRRRGWVIHRIWGTQWWAERDREVARLQGVVKRVTT